jgi:hypothetical protein
MTDSRRITLVGRNPGAHGRQWLTGPTAGSRVIFIDAFTVLQYALDHGLNELQQDVERVVIDGMASPMDYLQFIAGIPYAFVGDVLYVLSDGSAFLSAAGARGNRLMYQLSIADVEFYLQTNYLIAPPNTVPMAA